VGKNALACFATVVNGVKVFVTGLRSDDIEGAVGELNELGRKSGGTASEVSKPKQAWLGSQ
jgi:hypothetical protein